MYNISHLMKHCIVLHFKFWLMISKQDLEVDMEIIISPLLRFLILIVDFEKETVALANSSKNQ